MSTTPSENQSKQINPYAAPKSPVSPRISKFLTTAILLFVVAGFATAGSLAYWRYSQSEEKGNALNFSRGPAVHTPDNFETPLPVDAIAKP